MVHQLDHALVLDVVLFLKSCFSSYISLLLVSLVFWQSVYNKIFFLFFFTLYYFKLTVKMKPFLFLPCMCLKKLSVFNLSVCFLKGRYLPAQVSERCICVWFLLTSAVNTGVFICKSSQNFKDSCDFFFHFFFCFWLFVGYFF